MLNIYFRDSKEVESLNYIKIIDDLFSKTQLTGADKERAIIKEIEQGEYLSDTHFIDRFGSKLLRYDMSTGCKVALSVLNNPDKIIDTIECGINAIATILAYCDIGNIIILNNDARIPRLLYHDGRINARLDNKDFYTISDLNDYIEWR